MAGKPVTRQVQQRRNSVRLRRIGHRLPAKNECTGQVRGLCPLEQQAKAVGKKSPAAVRRGRQRAAQQRLLVLTQAPCRVEVQRLRQGISQLLVA